MTARALSLLLALPILVASIPAAAITYGERDGDRHPNVGALVAEWREPGKKELFCSGTLISPTVFLTAAHCTAWLEDEGLEVWVTFDSEYTERSKVFHGTPHTNPEYGARQDDPGDIAVVVLDQPIRNLEPARLPTEGLFDHLFAIGALRDQTFTAVGYGVHEPQVGPGGAVWPDTNERWVATSSFNALNNVWLRLSQNQATGDGGTCYGDSGGPNFLGDTDLIASLTVTGDAMCLATNTTYRLDTRSARAFLSRFVTLP